MPRIIKNMDARFNALKATKKNAQKKNSVDPHAEVLKLFGPKADEVEVGQGMAFKVPEGKTGKSHLASIRGKLTAVARKGQKWEGRVFMTAFDPENNEVIVKRIEDTDTPLAAKVGGRPAGTPNKPKEGTVEGVAGIEKARAHLNGTKGTVPVAQTNAAEPTPTVADTSKKAGTGNKGKGTKPAPAPVKDLTPPAA